MDVVPNDRVNISELLLPECEVSINLGLGADYPSQARIYVDGRESSLTAAKLGIVQKLALSPGEHSLQLRTPGGKVLWSRKLFMKKGETKNIVIE